ncbi:3-ketodihydrosphingosine reductase-like [Ptychodera flava]|uniref:3-ketodihydrosphingosine reductase-like n=1 Tax=Ptychodera flava TaxID=63121 RepID=UPI00396A0B0A
MQLIVDPIVALAIFVAFILVIYVFSPLITPRTLKIDRGHVIITGGSSGIGKAFAIEAVKRGANVTVLARNKERLKQCKVEIEKHLKYPDTQKVLTFSVDVAKDYDTLAQAVKEAIEEAGPCDLLLNSAGFAIAKAFEDTDLEEFKRLLDINYLGAVATTKAVLPYMKERKQGRLVFVSSQAGQLGVYGYTGYCASKFALRGFAEALQMEVKPYNVYITLSFPPDTDTPGFQTENISKPRETHLISESSGLFQPEYVANAIFNDALLGRFLSYIGVDGMMLANLTCGFSPVTSMMEGVKQVASMGLFRVISFFYLGSFDRIIKKCMEEKNSTGTERQ